MRSLSHSNWGKCGCIGRALTCLEGERSLQGLFHVLLSQLDSYGAVDGGVDRFEGKVASSINCQFLFRMNKEPMWLLVRLENFGNSSNRHVSIGQERKHGGQDLHRCFNDVEEL